MAGYEAKYWAVRGILKSNLRAFGNAKDLSYCSGYPLWICERVWAEVKGKNRELISRAQMIGCMVLGMFALWGYDMITRPWLYWW